MSGFPLADLTAESPLTLHDRPPPPGEEPSTAVSMATPEYFDTMRIPLRAGRWFDERDGAEGPAVAIINETLARQHWPDRDPLTRRVSVQVSGQAFRGTFEAEIVGVVGTVRPRGFDSLPHPEVFIPHAQAPNGAMTYVVRTIGDPAASIPAIQSVVWDAAPYLAFYSVATVEQLLSDTLAARRFTTLLLALFGAAALHPTRRRMRRPRPPSPRPKRTSTSREAQQMSESDLERELHRRGQELMRKLLQGHLDQRSPGEAAGPVEGADGVERSERRGHERHLETIFGTVQVERVGYARAGHESLHPLDAALNLPPERYSLEVRRRVAEATASRSFDEALLDLSHSTGRRCRIVRRNSWWFARLRTSTRSTRRAVRRRASRHPRGRWLC